MNHCRDCNSDYAAPGTCNCFAPGGKRHAAPTLTPWTPIYPGTYPYPIWVVPYWERPYTPMWQQPYTLTTTATNASDVAIWNTTS